MSECGRNRGYATEAVRALVQLRLEQADTVVINGLALPHTGPSNHVLQKIGVADQGLVAIDGEPCRHYQRIR